MWSYEDPKPAADAIRERVALWKGVSVSREEDALCVRTMASFLRIEPLRPRDIAAVRPGRVPRTSLLAPVTLPSIAIPTKHLLWVGRLRRQADRIHRGRSMQCCLRIHQAVHRGAWATGTQLRQAAVAPCTEPSQGSALHWAGGRYRSCRRYRSPSGGNGWLAQTPLRAWISIWPAYLSPCPWRSGALGFCAVTRFLRRPTTLFASQAHTDTSWRTSCPTQLGPCWP